LERLLLLLLLLLLLPLLFEFLSKDFISRIVEQPLPFVAFPRVDAIPEGT